ncbi:MAG TPA: carboxypeptidase regulatory-like domain-containing protein, partial [Vicinamibacterales bacterium]|nr:carboxypeptidase regulatory-like domain-containing protein [Vicinamibacterales bacterium]
MRPHVVRVLCASAGAFALASLAPLHAAQAPAPRCHVSGRATSNGKPLPGVEIVATRKDAAPGAGAIATSTDTDGAYRIGLPLGTFTLAVRLTGFTPIDREITLPSPPCDQTLDVTLRLAPRDQPLGAKQPPSAPPPANAARTPTGASRFQRLDVQSSATASENAEPSAAPDREAADGATRLLLPPGFSTDAPTEAVAINGNAASLDRGLMNDRFAALGRGAFDPVTGEVAPGFALAGVDGGQGRGGPLGGGRGGRGGQAGRGGPGGFVLGGRGGRQNGLNATMNYSFGGSMFDAAPYQLHPDSPTPKRPYTKQSFGVTIGGPLRIPHVYDGSRRTMVIASYTGNRGSTLFDQFATVPEAALRAGDFSGAGVVIDPLTGLPFAGNQIPANRISPAAATLLQFIPLPNTDAIRNNFHYTTTTRSALDNVNLRVIQSFTPVAPNGRVGFGGLGGRGGAGRFAGGRSGRQGTNVVLTAQMQYRRTHSDQANIFPTLGGQTSGWNLALPVTLNVQHKRSLHNFSVNFSETHSATTNQYAFAQDIARSAGIAGVSTDPFDWGLPSLSFANFSNARDLTPSARTDRRLATAYTWTHPVSTHTLRAGGDVRFDRSASEVDANPRGAFVFTGLYTGGGFAGSTGTDLDFADFLLGLPQQASVQYGPGNVSVNGRSMSLFVQDDWRKSAGLTVSLGLRYELLWPFTESHGDMVNLDVAPDFTAAIPVVSGGSGPFTGRFPVGLIQPDTNNFAPRLGLAWRIRPGMILRGGYGISYNSGTYSTIARQMVGQPPFAVTETTIGTLRAPLSILDPF